MLKLEGERSTSPSTPSPDSISPPPISGLKQPSNSSAPPTNGDRSYRKAGKPPSPLCSPLKARSKIPAPPTSPRNSRTIPVESCSNMQTFLIQELERSFQIRTFSSPTSGSPKLDPRPLRSMHVRLFGHKSSTPGAKP